MRVVIEELNDRWDDFVCKVSSEDGRCDCGVSEVNEYSRLMVETFKILQAEWNSEMVRKDIALLFLTLGSFVQQSDDDGNVLGTEEYEQITTFHEVFFTNMFRTDCFNFDQQGNLLLETYEEKILVIDPKTFELPSVDALYGIGD